MNYRLSRKLFWILFLLGLIIMFIASFVSEEKRMIVCYISGAVMALGVMIELIWYRCPKCKSSLPSRGFAPDYCPRCGEKLP